MRLSRIVEGKTTLWVPSVSLEAAVPPTAPAFFNPAAVVNRDISVAMAETTESKTFCDSLAGVGARGVRIAVETSQKAHVTMVDFNGDALKVAERSAAANGVKGRCGFVLGETREFLHSRFGKGEKFECVDVDPFGSPAPYMQAAVSATSSSGVVSVTATDTAALCGVYPLVARRRYSAVSLNNSFHHETGLRILMNAVRRQAGLLERGVIPLAAHSTRHYLRVYARVVDGAAKADASLKDEGYVSVCSKCGDVAHGEAPPSKCNRCGGRVRWAGPLWTGKLADEEQTERAASWAGREGRKEAQRVLAALREVNAFPPWSFSIEGICSSLGVATVPDDGVRRFLKEAGFRSSRQPFEKTGLKTDAPCSVVVDAVRNSAR